MLDREEFWEQLCGLLPLQRHSSCNEADKGWRFLCNVMGETNSRFILGLQCFPSLDCEDWETFWSRKTSHSKSILQEPLFHAAAFHLSTLQWFHFHLPFSNTNQLCKDFPWKSCHSSIVRYVPKVLFSWAVQRQTIHTYGSRKVKQNRAHRDNLGAASVSYQIVFFFSLV